MNVLVITDRQPGTTINTSSFRLYLGFLYRLKEYCGFYLYGPEENKYDPANAPIRYNDKLTISNIVSELNINIVLTPTQAVSKRILPPKGEKDFPLICIESDFYNIPEEVKKHWYIDNGYTHIIQRGFYPESNKILPSVWLPLSASEEFYTDISTNYLDNRLNKIAFIGKRHKSVPRRYKSRDLMVEILEKYEWFEDIGPTQYADKPIDSEYPKLLKKYLCCISDSAGELHGTLGKLYEIMASGTVLLTTPVDERIKKILFNNEKCFIECSDDLSDLVDLAKFILNNKDEMKIITSNALNVINTSHLHKHRILELLNIIEAIVNGGGLPRKWGI